MAAATTLERIADAATLLTQFNVSQTKRSKEAINSAYQELSNVTWFADIVRSTFYSPFQPIEIPPAEATPAYADNAHSG